MSDNDTLWLAFQAGFDASAEGFNGEVVVYRSLDELRDEFTEWLAKEERLAGFQAARAAQLQRGDVKP